MSAATRRPYSCGRLRGLSYADFLKQVLYVAEELHDEKQWEHSRPLFIKLNEHALCYHIVYRLGIYKWEGWATESSRAEGGKLWSKAKTLMTDLIHREPLAAFDMGVLWDRGYPEQDFIMAMKFYEIASSGGNAKAKFNIALMYKRGEGVQPDDETAAKYMEEAAIYGHKQATLSIAKYYAEGIGCKKDRKVALGYYKIAVEKWKDEYSSNKVANWYGKGKDIPKDIRMALKYTTQKSVLTRYWDPIWTEVWPQMTILKAVINQEEDESPFHVFPAEVIELFRQSLVDVYFYDKEKEEWSFEKEYSDYDFRL